MEPTKEFIKFLKHSSSTYHLLDYTTSILKNNKFKQFDSFDDIKPGKYYTTINNIILAFTIPNNINEIKIIATHSDSPCLKIKPNVSEFDKQQKLSLYPYGGGIWSTWFDRTLGIAGTIYANNKKYLIKKELNVVIPSLPPHLKLNSESNFSVETHLKAVSSTLDVQFISEFLKQKEIKCLESCTYCDKNEVLESCKNKILSFDLNLYDTQGPVFCGLNDEFISAQNLDNKISVFCALMAVISADSTNSLNIFASFEFEEVGSRNVNGALSFSYVNFINELIKSLKIKKEVGSYIISADVAHAYNSNYSENYCSKNMAVSGKGPVIKYSDYNATSAEAVAYIKNLASVEEIPVQEFFLKNNIRGGSTIGPFITCNLGIKGVDIGTPIFAMHSIREMVSKKDLLDTLKLFRRFYV